MTHTITAGRIPNLQPAVSTKISVTNAPDLLDEHLARGAVGITHDVHAAVRSGRLAAAQVIIAYDGGGRASGVAVSTTPTPVGASSVVKVSSSP